MNTDKEIYKLPKGWIWSTLDDVTLKITDGSHNPPTKQASGIVMLSARNINNNHIDFNNGVRYISEEAFNYEQQRANIESGDILLTIVASIGRSALVPENLKQKISIQRSVALIKPCLIPGRYLMYAIQAPFFQKLLNSEAKGTAQKGVYLGTLKSLPIPIPPLSEQYAIVERIDELLSEIDNSILSLQLAEIQLKLYKQTVLNDAFNGKTTINRRRDIVTETANDLLSGIAEERKTVYLNEQENWKYNIQNWEEAGRVGKKPAFPKSFKTMLISEDEISKLPLLPEGWEYTKISNIANVSTGVTPLKSRMDYYHNGTIPWITSGSLNDWYVSAPSTYITNAAIKENNLKIYPKHTLLVALYGEGKTRGKCSELLFDSAINQAIAAIVQTGLETTLRSYLKWFLLKNYVELRELASGGAQQNLNLGIIQNIIVPIANPEEIELIVEHLEFNFSVIENIEATIIDNLSKSEQLRQTILNNGFLGKLVPQHFTGESAASFLNQIKNVKYPYLEEKIAIKKKRMINMKPENKSIIEVLKSSNNPMAAEEVWKQSRHKDNIEEFYAELKKVQADVVELKKGILSLSK